MKRKFIAYYRVSTAQQGKSGLGLEAQKSAVESYLNGGKWELLGEFTEVESGKRKSRPELQAALALCKKHKATLVIAKLDRLARNVHFISGLMKSNIDFVAVDMPSANRFILHVLAAVAEEEANVISARTKAALASAKARGVKLGRYGKTLGKLSAAAAREHAKRLRPIIKSLRVKGISSVRAIASSLNDQKIPTLQGKLWHSTSVQRLLTRM